MTSTQLSMSLALVGALMFVGNAHAAPILVGTSQGRYNAALGTTLDGTDAAFPCANSACGDPLVTPIAPEPSLAAAAGILGDWLGNPPTFNANWTAPIAIPSTWAVNTETAIVYEFVLTTQSALTANFGVDNGLYVWLNGAYKFGAMAPGGSNPMEYANVNLGVLSAGTHYLQVLREDHGGLTGFDMAVTATPVPEPAVMSLLGLGFAGFAAAARRRARRG